MLSYGGDSTHRRLFNMITTWWAKKGAFSRISSKLPKIIVINRFFMKLFNTNIMDTVKFCQDQFGCELPSVLTAKRTDKFLARYKQFELDHDCFNI